MEITYYGHACFMLSAAGKQLLFDPFISGNEQAKDIDISAIKPDYILLSHAHFDHISDVVQIQKQSGAKLIANWEITSYFGQQGLPGHPMNIGGSWKFSFGKVSMTYAQHSSSFADGSYGGNPCGFVIEAEGKSIYYTGDTALFSDMKLIAEKFRPEFSILCMGDNFTMGPEDALQAAAWLGAKTVIGVHYDTFPYIVIDQAKTKQAFEDKGFRLKLLAIGETMPLG
ncbi:MAG TPA: metal-dependent hydrolase [Cyclobacteriaceae bacterium]|nr:metal-dependent hydrolase [Cyclobacteriaceae bacterium]